MSTMPDRETPYSLRTPIESAAAAQLRKGHKWLRFDSDLEREFRSIYLTQSQGSIRLNLWLALGLVMAFSGMGHLVIPHGSDFFIDVFHVAIFLPLVAGALALTYTPLYRRWFGVIVQVMAPLFAVSVAVLELMAENLGISFLAGAVLAIICMYFLVGMLFYAAVRSGLVVMAAYAVGATLSDSPGSQVAYNGLVLFFANVIGATVCYTLETVTRTNYLESRLLKEMASLDGLTGIYNRRMLDEHLDKAWQQGIREQAPVALLLIDIDHFKAYNDYYGHQAGDECLRSVAHTLARCARRPLDFTARYGGEEFAIVLYNARRDYVEELTRLIQQQVEALAVKHPASPARRLTVSIGAACVVPAAGRSHFGFVQLADEALYAAKEAGRNRVVLMDREYAELSTGSFRNRSQRQAVV